jgi:formylglycine-generating enzyme required for sulfatase activity
VNAQPAPRDPLMSALRSARRFLLAHLPPEELWGEQPSALYSPIGWHLGHIASMQARWLLPGEPLQYGQFFDPFRTSKSLRATVPKPKELRAYLDEIHARVTDGLRRGRVPGVLGLPESFLVLHVAQHELQHAEHVRVVHALCEGRLHRAPKPVPVRSAMRVEFAGGPVQVGCADPAVAYDNERPRHEVLLEPYWLDRAPVTVREFAEFVEQGGYEQRKLWTEAGWEWRKGHRSPLGFDEQHPDAPVTCVTWFEADAYTRFRGTRLPTEHELEASGLPHAGVWEWTSSWFQPYPGFRPYPYDGYSTPWFHTHRVLRGASWATSPDLARPSLRNWYEPGTREIPSGFRCAGGA